MHLRQEALLGQMATFRIHSEFLKWEGWTILEVALWPPHAKSWLIGKDSDAGRDWGQEEKGTTEDEMAIWHHWLDRRESEWTPGVGDGQGGLACFNSWGRKESDMTERLNWTELNWTDWRLCYFSATSSQNGSTCYKVQSRENEVYSFQLQVQKILSNVFNF